MKNDEEKNVKNKKFLTHFMMIGTGTILNMFIGLFTTPVITRLVGKDVYGQFSIFTMYVSIGVMILCMGLDQGIIRFYYKENATSYRRKLIRASCILPIFATVLVTIVFVLLSENQIIQFEFDTLILGLLGICILIQIINRLNMVQLRVAYKTKEYSIIHVAHKLIFIILTIVLIAVFHKQHFISMVMATIISYILVALYGIYVQRDEWKFWQIPRSEKFNYKELYLYSAPYIISMGVTTLFQAIDKLSLNSYCTYSEVGIYASAMNIISIFAIVQSTFNALWAPMAIEHFHQNPEDRSFYQKANSLITVVMFFIGSTLILFKDVFVLLLGEQYREAAYIVPCLIFNPIMYTISETTVGGIVFKKKSSMQIVVAIIACVTNICGNSFLVPLLGGRGAAISTGISYIVFFIARTLIANKYFPVNWKLKKFFLLTGIVLVYTLYNTFYENVGISVLGYLVILITMIVMYKDVIIGVVKLGYRQIKKI